MEHITQRNYRRHQNTLIIEGLGIFALGIWTVIKTVMSALFIPGSFEPAGQDNWAAYLTTSVVFTALDLSIRFYIFRSAVREARGERRSRLYLFFAALICLGNLTLIMLCVFAISHGYLHDQALFDFVAGVLIELTSLFIIIDFIRSAILVRKKR